MSIKDHKLHAQSRVSETKHSRNWYSTDPGISQINNYSDSEPFISDRREVVIHNPGHELCRRAGLSYGLISSHIFMSETKG